MKIMKCSKSVTFSLFLLLLALASISKAKAGGIVTYWGQDEREGKLTDTCNSGKYRIVNVAFLSKFGNGQKPEINLAGHCDGAANRCQNVGTGIRNCQNQHVKVLLSIGGSGGSYSLSSADEANSVADYIFDNFLSGHSNSRPFGDAVMDGVDFDIEQGVSHYAALAKRLLARSNGGRKVYLGAAPQCPFPDHWLGHTLSTVPFDYIWIQFYNNPECEFSSNDPEKFKSSWRQWISSTMARKYYVGLPAAATEAASNGFVSADLVNSQVLPFVEGSSGDKYGGVMLWNRYYDARDGFSDKIRNQI